MAFARVYLNRFAIVACLLAGAATQADARDPRPPTPVAPPAASAEQPHRPHLYDPSMQGITANSNAAKYGVSNRPK
jgi:hypothetical protein